MNVKFSFAVAVLIAWFFAASATTQAEVVRDKLADFCRFDLLAPPEAGSLYDGHLIAGDGWVSRVAWLPVESQACTYVVHAAVNHYSWTDVTFRFVPEKDAHIQWHLSGRWQQFDSNTLFRQVVEWRDARVEGATLTTQFEESVTSWHNDPREVGMNVEGGQAVIVRIKVRAVPPPDFKWMQRIESTNTPAHRAMAHFRRGVSLGNNLEAPRGSNWGAWYTPSDLRHIAREGFDHVRLPVAWHEYIGPAPSYKLNGPIFIYVDRILGMALTNNLAVIINLQHFAPFMDNPDRETPRLMAIWEQVAAHYADSPTTVAFELLNEPNSNAVTWALNPIYHKVIGAIRKTNPDRTVFLDPGGWSSPTDLPQLWLPDWDSNIVVTVHCYEPFLFTHQGAPWAIPFTSTTNIVYPGPPPCHVQAHPACEQMPDVTEWLNRYNKWFPDINPCSVRRVRQSMIQARAWSDYYGRPVHVGEFGCYYVMDPSSRFRYLHDMRTTIEQAGLGWAIWDWKAGFRYWDPSTARPLPGLHQALFGK
jgi:endoglucanase